MTSRAFAPTLSRMRVHAGILLAREPGNSDALFVIQGRVRVHIDAWRVGAGVAFKVF